MYRCWVSTGDIVMCVHGEGEVHLLRREVSPPPESSNVSGRFGNTCALLSLCLSLTLTADTEARNVIYALHWINTILHWIAGNFHRRKLSQISSFNGCFLCEIWWHGILWRWQSVVRESFLCENLFSTSLKVCYTHPVHHSTCIYTALLYSDVILVASHPGLPFWILSRNFGATSTFLLYSVVSSRYMQVPW